MKNEMKIYTDGSALGNPGPGGWGAFFLFSDGEEKEIGGSEKHTTNNRMELTAAIEALSFVKTIKQLNNLTITLYTDSKYVHSGITEWVHGWIRNGWRTANKKPVLNQDLWEKLHDLNQQIDVKWEHLPGHSGIHGNEMADKIATTYAQNQN